MKKLLSLLAAALVSTAAICTPVYAEEDPAETESESYTVDKSTICFDNDGTFDKITLFGSYEATGLSYKITSEKVRNNSSLEVSQNFSGSLPSGSEVSGFYYNADAFGLESFSGTTISLYAYVPNSGADQVLFYTDGDIYMTAEAEQSDAPYWKEYTLSVPDNINNTMFGVLIKASEGNDSVVCYIDDVNITDENGVKIDNIGDFREYSAKKTGGASSVITTIVFVILLVAVVGGTAYFIFKSIHRYR